MDIGDELDQRRALLDAWVDTRRRIALLEAESSALLAERIRLRDRDTKGNSFHRDAIHLSMVAEYSAAGRIPQGTADRAFADAYFIENHYPLVRDALHRGDITAAHAREIVGAGSVVREAIAAGAVEPETQTVFEAASIVVAENDTPARTRAYARSIAAALAGETVVERQRRAASERTVTVRPADDGLALLQVVLPEHLAAAIFDRLTQMANEVIRTRDDRDPCLDPDVIDMGADPIFPGSLDPSDPALDDFFIFGPGDTFTSDPLVDPSSSDIEHVAGDERTLDQVRADLLTDLLLGSDPGEVHGSGLENIRGRVQVTVAGSTLAGDDDRPAEHDGKGPIDPDVARDLAGCTASWSRLFLDHTGMITATDSYAPTEAMRRFLRARDPHCRFPGCRMPVHRCQFDHNHDHAKGGATSLDNLSAFCAGHHLLKHPDMDDGSRWTARQVPGGDIEWTSPLGRVYSDPPPRRVMFV